MNHAGLQIDAENPFEFETSAASVLLETSKLVRIPPLLLRAADTAAGNTHPALASCAGQWCRMETLVGFSRYLFPSFPRTAIHP